MTQATPLSQTPTESDETLPSLPSDLDAPRTKLVFQSLLVAGGATVEDLAVRINERLLALYPILADLRERGLVVRDGERYEATY